MYDEKVKIIIAGGRDFRNYSLLSATLNEIIKDPKETIIVSGGANGADTLGEAYAKENNIDLMIFPADWDTYGRSAGYIRNAEMAKFSDILIAFWDQESSGTKHMIQLAKTNGIKGKVVFY